MLAAGGGTSVAVILESVKFLFDKSVGSKYLSFCERMLGELPIAWSAILITIILQFPGLRKHIG